MTTPSSSRPTAKALIGIGIAVITLAVAAGFIGRSLAGRDAAAATTTVPIVQPVAYGDTALPPVTDETYANGLSAATGSIEVPTGDAAPVPALPKLDLSRPAPPAPAAVRDELEAPEPESGLPTRELLTEFGGVDAGAPPVTDDADTRLADPCAARSGGPSETCPEGVRSTIFADRAVPDLWVMATAYPAPPGSRTNVFCPARTPGPGVVPFGIGSIAPGTATFRYWDSRLGPASAREIVVGNTPEVRSAWEAAFAAGETFDNPALRPQLCFDVPGITTGVSYDWSVVYADIFGRIATATVTSPFGYDPSLTRGPRTRPPTMFIPISANRVLISVAHRANETADLRAFIGDSGGACGLGSTAPDRDSYALWVGPQTTTEVSREFLERRNYIDEFRRRSTAIVLISNATTATLCARTFPGEGRSFDTGRANYVETSVVQSPDRLLPSIELIGLDLSRGTQRDDVRIQISLGSTGCSDWRGPAAASEPGALPLPAGAARCDANERVSGYTGTTRPIFRVTSFVKVGDDFRDSSTAIAARARVCTGGDAGAPPSCPRPSTQIYRLALPTVRVGSGLCSPGLFESSCTPPTREQSVGVATFRVSWSDGGSAGRPTWSVGPSTRPPADGLPPMPQLDVDIQPTLDAGRNLRTELVADRPVTWEVTTTTTCRVRPAPGPVTQPTPSERFGFVLEDLCVGADYVLRVSITDPTTGANSVWSLPDGTLGVNVWRYALVRSPAVPINVFAELVAGEPATSARVRDWYALELDANIPWNAEAIQRWAEGGRCNFTEPAPRAGTYGVVRSTRANIITLYAGETTRIAIEASMVPSGGTFSCTPYTLRDPLVVATEVEIPLERFAGREPIVISATGGAYPVTLVLQPTR